MAENWYTALVQLGYRRLVSRTTVAGLLPAFKHPRQTASYIRARMRPESYWSRYRKACGRSLKGPRFLLSLDCDTQQDVTVVEEVHKRLAAGGAMPTYAVPGELMVRGADTYQRLAKLGASFMNHGYREHSVLDDETGLYLSTFDYHDVPWRRVVEDIESGHQALIDVLGQAPRGYRTPHFGSFQRRAQLALIHSTLERLEYRWTSSTVPRYAYSRGPAFRDFGLWELPVSGRPRRPLSVLDSFSYRFAPGRKVDDADFIADLSWLAAELDKEDPFLVNLYVDPSQVSGWNDFFVCVEALSKWATSFDELVEEVNQKS